MMTDIRNQKVFASFLQRFDVQFDLISILDELEEQVLAFYLFIISRFSCSMYTLGDFQQSQLFLLPDMFLLLQVEFEFDFVREAKSMDRISESLNVAFKGKCPITIPHSVPNLVTE